MSRKLGAGFDRTFQNERKRVERAAIQLALLDPTSVLDRGYSILQSMDGGVLGSIDQIQVGQHVRSVLADGVVEMTVSGKV
jgi:exodeoxyribonuclease VII large subunit